MSFSEMVASSTLTLLFTTLAVVAVSSAAQAELGLSSSLHMVIVLFRHGARSPVTTYPTDPNRFYPWIGGLGALQPEGTKDAIQLGRNFRRRYNALLPKDEVDSAEKVYVVSSAKERCIMSAQAILAGLLETPTEGPSTRTVNVLPTADDYILQQSKKCIKADIASQVFDESPTGSFIEWKKQAYVQMAYVSEHTREPMNSLEDLVTFYDNIIIAKYYGLPVPDWTAAIYPGKAMDYYKGYLLKYTATPELKRLRGGVILTAFLNLMKSKRDGELEPDGSFFLYSGHDLCQVSLLNSMGKINQTTAKPDFTSAVAFELHRNLALKDDMELRMVYYDGAYVKIPRQLEVPDCPKPCPLKRFQYTMQYLYVPNYDAECNAA